MVNWVSIPKGNSNPGLFKEGKPVPVVLVGHQLTPFLHPLPGGPAEAATGQHQRQALERPDEPADAPHRARR